ncbi:UDP-N-acetylglucosamine 2-epimerase [Paenibacillus sp. GCM10027627]|uniref:UDP-N-acetylglucosamine 2-epimerase n=1 Tax=unclassified Paenibacillus TaxID=185978 RepID=UPI0036439A32
MNEKQQKVLALTGIRSEYDLLFPLLEALDNHPEYDLGVIVSGAHLTPLHHYSVKQIERDGFRIVEKIESLLYSNSFLGKAKSSAILMSSLAQVLARENPDFLLLLGDREEAIVGSLTASFMNIPVIHLAGGDNTASEGGNVDEQVRHASTKLSHIHLTMMEEHSERIRKLGEEEWRIHTVGSAGVDRLRKVPHLSKQELAAILKQESMEDYIILIYHPLSSNIEAAAAEMRLCIEESILTGKKLFIGMPNSDPGWQTVADVINEYTSHPLVQIYRNLERNSFVNLLRHAKCLIGNSSLAIHEGAYLSLPAINVGERQRARIAGSNVQFVSGTSDEIRNALHKALNDHEYQASIERDKFIYGDGFMVEKSLDIFKSLPGKEQLLAKKITY